MSQAKKKSIDNLLDVRETVVASVFPAKIQKWTRWGWEMATWSAAKRFIL